MSQQRNPFIVALVGIGIVAGLLAFVLAGVSGNYPDDPVSAAGWNWWAGVLFHVGVFAVLGALVAAAITWRPAARTEQPSVDATGLTPGEQRFFSGDS